MSDLRIHAALAPRVAVLSSPDVDRIIQFNNIPDLPTLLRPFESSVERLSVRTSQLETRICDRFPLRFDPYSLFNPDATHDLSSQPRASAVGRSNEELLDRVNHLIAANIKGWVASVPCLTASPSTHSTANTKEKGGEDEEKSRGEVLDEVLLKLQRSTVEEATPWFTAVQQLVFSQRTIAKHESFGHPVAILLAVSSASPDPMNDFAKLYETSCQQNPFAKHPYINPDTLKYYVLIHDVRTSGSDLAGSKELLDQIKRVYGLHCCLLTINSASDDRAEVPASLAGLWTPYLSNSPSSPTTPTPEGIGLYLDEEDLKRIRNFIRELTAQSIVPFMERYVQHMGEYLANSRKGLTNRLFGASRKLFSSSSSTNSSNTNSGLATAGGYDAQSEFYPYSSIEAQTRRLADFAFTIRDYKLAASMYDMGRKDFSGDKAHKHAAGATEMFGLSHLMLIFATRGGVVDVDSYLSQACTEYSFRSGPGMRVEETYALRATLLYYEAYRLLSYLRPAPPALLGMALSSEEVLSPLLLEQAALSCLQTKPKPALRKFAFHLVSAAHKYQACGQKLLSLRCYAQAALVYKNKGWLMVETHIERELGLQAYNEGDMDAAVEHLLRLIRVSEGNERDNEQQSWLREVVEAYRFSRRERVRLGWQGEVFVAKSARLRFDAGELVGDAGDAGGEEVWEELEERLVDVGLGERTMGKGQKKRRKRPASKSSGQGGEVAVGQSFALEVVVRNPLGVELSIDEIKPVLQRDDSPLSAEEYESETLPPLTLGPHEHRPMRIPLRVNTEAKHLRITKLDFRLAETMHLTQKLEKKGRRLNGNKDERTSISYAPDTSLVVSVHATRPTLRAKFVDAPKEMYLGEERRCKVVIKNQGNVTVDDVRSLCSHPSIATFSAASDQGKELEVRNDLETAPPEFVLDSDGTIELQRGEEREVELLVRPSVLGDLSLAWLLAFSPADGEETYTCRLAVSLRVEQAVEVSVETKTKRGRELQHEVMVEVTNCLATKEVRLDGFSVFSPRWCIRRAKEEGKREEVVIGPKQTWRGGLTISTNATAGGAEEGEKYTETKLQDLLLSRDRKRRPPPPVSLHQSSSTLGPNPLPAPLPTSVYVESRKEWKKATLSTLLPTMPARERENILTLLNTGEFDLSAHFSLCASQTRESRSGRLWLFGLSPGPSRSTIRAITHPKLEDAAGDKSKIRSLYAQTVREKATLLQNILTSPLNTETNPVVVHTEVKEGEKIEFIVRNFSDLLEARVEVQLEDGQEQGEEGQWVGRKTLRCNTVLAGEVRVLEGVRRGEGGRVRYGVVVETFLGSTEDDGERVLVARYAEQH